MVVVHRFKKQDGSTGEWVVELSKRTEQHIKMLGGQIIAGTAEEVDPMTVDSEGRYKPPIKSSEI